MEPLVVSDGTDTATLTPGEESWTIKLEVPADQPERVQRLLEAAAQAAVLDGGGRLDYWVESIDENADRIPFGACLAPSPPWTPTFPPAHSPTTTRTASSRSTTGRSIGTRSRVPGKRGTWRLAEPNPGTTRRVSGSGNGTVVSGASAGPRSTTTPSQSWARSTSSPWTRTSTERVSAASWYLPAWHG